MSDINKHIKRFTFKGKDLVKIVNSKLKGIENIIK